MKEDKNIRILFVCTGNIFRSLIAQKSLQEHLKNKKVKNVIVNSAGTTARKQTMHPTVRAQLESLGIKNLKHEQKKLTNKDLLENDIVIVMSQDHQDFIKKKFGFEEALLYNQILKNERTSIKDLGQAIKNPEKQPEKSEDYAKKTTVYIHKNIPKLYEKLTDYLLFTQFVKTKKNRAAGLPFKPLLQTKNTIAFMSIDIPKKEDGHVLVIPKKRYEKYHNIPKNIREELSSTIAIIGKALEKTHAGYNILLNNGSDAGQCIYHTHFHIIPRNKNDQIKIEVWKAQKLTEKRFLELNNKIIRAIKEK